MEASATPRADELALTQRINATVQQIYHTAPEVAQGFTAQPNRYELWLARLRISDRAGAVSKSRRPCASQFFSALLGGLFCRSPSTVGSSACRPRSSTWAVHRFANPNIRKARVSTATVVAGVIAFGVCYAGLHRWLSLDVRLADEPVVRIIAARHRFDCPLLLA